MAPPGKPVTPTPVRPGARFRVYVTAAAVDGPLLLNVTVELIVVAAVAVAGTVTATVTSASGEIALVEELLSGNVLGP